MRTAHIVQTLVNIHRDPKQHPEPFALADLLLFAATDEPADLGPDELAAKIARTLGAPDGAP